MTFLLILCVFSFTFSAAGSSVSRETSESWARAISLCSSLPISSQQTALQQLISRHVDTTSLAWPDLLLASSTLQLDTLLTLRRAAACGELAALTPFFLPSSFPDTPALIAATKHFSSLLAAAVPLSQDMLAASPSRDAASPGVRDAVTSAAEAAQADAYGGSAEVQWKAVRQARANHIEGIIGNVLPNMEGKGVKRELSAAFQGSAMAVRGMEQDGDVRAIMFLIETLFADDVLNEIRSE